MGIDSGSNFQVKYYSTVLSQEMQVQYESCISLGAKFMANESFFKSRGKSMLNFFVPTEQLFHEA